MKKIISFIMVLAMVLSVSSVAMAAEVTVPYNASNTALVNGQALFDTIMAAADGTIINVPAGTYELTDGNTSRIRGKSVTLVGKGQDVSTGTIIKGQKYGLVIQNTAGNHVEFTIKNMRIESLHDWGHSIYAKGNTVVNLENVTLTNPGTTAILVESINSVEGAGGDVLEDNITASVNAKGVTIDSGDTVEMETKPNSGISATAGMNTRAIFTYSSDCNNITDDICKSRSSNLGTDNVFVNEKCINPAVAQIGDTKYTSLQAAINAAQDAARTQPETVTIKLLADVSKDVIIKQEENLNLVIDGDGHKMTGTINIYGDSRYTGDETLTIQNIAFEKDSGDAISSDSTDGDKRYAHNVTIKDCTFTGDAIVGTRIRQGYNISIIDCVMNSGHSLMQNSNNTGVTVKGTEVNATEGGLNLFASTGVRVEDCDITAGDYGVRVDADGSGDATITNTKIDAEQPVIVRKVTDSYNLTANTGNIFTVGDDKAPVNIEDGTGTVTYTDNFVAMNGTTNTYYNSMDEAIADANPGETVYPVENGDIIEEGAVTIPEPTAPTKPRDSIKVTYNGGNSFSTSKSAVPTSVEIDGVPVVFNGDGRNFTVSCVDPDAEWVTVRWNSTSVTVNFKPDVNVVCSSISIPKTGDMPLWAAVLAFFSF